MCQNIYYDNTSLKIYRRGLEGQSTTKGLEDDPSPTGHIVHQTDDTYERSTLSREVVYRRAKKADQKSIDVDAEKTVPVNKHKKTVIQADTMNNAAIKADIMNNAHIKADT